MRGYVFLILVFLSFSMTFCSVPRKDSAVKEKAISKSLSTEKVEYSSQTFSQKMSKSFKSDRLDEIFRIACVNNDRDRVIELLQKGVNVNSIDRNGDTPLHLAVYYNSIEVVKILVRYGANPRIRNRQGFSPIDIAREKGYVEIYKLLLRY